MGKKNRKNGGAATAELPPQVKKFFITASTKGGRPRSLLTNQFGMERRLIDNIASGQATPSSKAVAFVQQHI